MADNLTEVTPIDHVAPPGHSLTDTPRNFPWENPYEISNPIEGVKHHLAKLAQPKSMESVLYLLQEGIPIKTLVSTMMTTATATGIHSIDLGLIISPSIFVEIKGLADKAGIPYKEDFGKDEETTTEDKKEQAIIRAIELDLEDSPEMNTGIIDETTSALASEEVDLFQQRMNVDDPRSISVEEQPTLENKTDPAAEEAMASMRDASTALDTLDETKEDPKSMGLMSRGVM